MRFTEKLGDAVTILIKGFLFLCGHAPSAEETDGYDASHYGYDTDLGRSARAMGQEPPGQSK